MYRRLSFTSVWRKHGNGLNTKGGSSFSSARVLQRRFSAACADGFVGVVARIGPNSLSQHPLPIGVRFFSSFHEENPNRRKGNGVDESPRKFASESAEKRSGSSTRRPKGSTPASSGSGPHDNAAANRLWRTSSNLRKEMEIYNISKTSDTVVSDGRSRSDSPSMDSQIHKTTQNSRPAFRRDEASIQRNQEGSSARSEQNTGSANSLFHSDVRKPPTKPRGSSPRKNQSSLFSFFEKMDSTLAKNMTADNSAPQSSPSQLELPICSDPLIRKGKSHTNPKTSTTTDETSVTALTDRPISDLFPIIPSITILGSNAYEETAFLEYRDLLNRLQNGPLSLQHQKRVPEEQITAVTDWLYAPEPVVEVHLPSLYSALEGGLSSETFAETSNRFRAEIDEQKRRFLEHLGWGEHQIQLASKILSSVGKRCARDATALPVEVSWQKLKEIGIMDKKMLDNYVYVSFTFSAQSIQTYSKTSEGPIFGNNDQRGGENSSIGAPLFSREDDVGEKFVDVAREAALSHDLLFEPSERSLNIRSRILVAQGKSSEAEHLLERYLKSEEARLRTYAPIYSSYIEQNDLASAFRVYKKMRNCPSVVMLTENFIQLMACVAENGFFLPSAKPIEGVIDGRFQYGSGPGLFDQLAADLAENTIEITPAAAKRLYNAFQKGHKDEDGNPLLEELHVFESLSPFNEPATPDELIVSRVQIDERNGQCPRSRTKLRLIDLDREQKGRLRDRLYNLASENAFSSPRLAVFELKKFSHWLDNRTGNPFTAIIDGPNVGYYMQNFGNGIFNFYQIQFVVDALEKRGENVLVVLPQKYAGRRFFDTRNSRSVPQYMSPKERAIFDKLRKSGKLYICPRGCLDDMYWMYASVASQKRSTNDDEMHVPPGNAQGRWAGIRPILISNDKMRDHSLALLEPRLFARWRSNCIINFSFMPFVLDRCQDDEINFSTADFYSREIQGNPIKCESGRDNGTVWHFPVSSWDENEVLCIRVPGLQE